MPVAETYCFVKNLITRYQIFLRGLVALCHFAFFFSLLAHSAPEGLIQGCNQELCQLPFPSPNVFDKGYLTRADGLELFAMMWFLIEDYTCAYKQIIVWAIEHTPWGIDIFKADEFLEPLAMELPITNLFIASQLVIITLAGFMYLSEGRSTIKRKASRPFMWITSLKFFETGLEFCSQMLAGIPNKEKFIPVVFTLFNFILFGNLFGLVPHAFTITSQLFVTFTLSFSVFIWVNAIIFNKHGLQTFALFLPAHTSFFLAIILVPLEFISHLIKPFSLGLRLFINLMAGHTLLKVIAGFICSMLFLKSFAALTFVLPFAALVILTGLELGVAILQACVFIALSCNYIKDGS